MVGTVFLWMFWPSFNAAAALPGEAQHRAVMNTYFSLCASVMAAFSVSAMLDDKNKFVMEHIQGHNLKNTCIALETWTLNQKGQYFWLSRPSDIKFLI
jgi:hypothetical protein